MTTLAYKNGIIATDSLTTVGDLVFSEAQRKIFSLGGKNFLVGAGRIATTDKMVAFIKENGITDLSKAGVMDGNAYMIWFSNELYYIDEQLFAVKLDKKKYYSIGTGREVALGVLSVKSTTAVQAVKAAIQIDVFSGGKVQFRKCL